MVETRDILIKAAEDVQQGMWCRIVPFFDGSDTYLPSDLLTSGKLSIDSASVSSRCAEGSIALATALLGGDWFDHDAAVNAVAERLPVASCNLYGADPHDRLGAYYLPHYNDYHLPDDPFEAGQQLAELFRETADAL